MLGFGENATLLTKYFFILFSLSCFEVCSNCLQPLCSHRNVFFDIAAPPVLTDFTSPIYGISPQSSEMFCSFYGNPEPVVYWKKLDGGTASDFTVAEQIDKVVSSITFKTSNITISKTSPQHYGVYQCYANNTHGFAVQNITFTVNCEYRNYSKYFNC